VTQAKIEVKEMQTDIHVSIRPGCLRAAGEWQRPRGSEIQEVVRRTGLSGRAVARALGLSEHGGRQVRRWISEDAPIPYTAWAILCDMVGFERIWLNGEATPEDDSGDD
jgi:hypothetical protein